MMFALCFKICLMRFFGRFKRSQVQRLSVNANVCLPVVSVFSHTKQTRRRTLLGMSSVFAVQFCSGSAKILDSIVVPNPVNVINVLWNWVAVMVKPRKSVGAVTFAERKNGQIPAVVLAACVVTNINTLRNLLAPVKFTRVWVVIKNISDMVGGYFHAGLFLHKLNIGVV
jgi:hypothetical protein